MSARSRDDTLSVARKTRSTCATSTSRRTVRGMGRAGQVAVVLVGSSMILFIVSTAAADPRPQAFVELEVGAGVASVSARSGLCGSYPAPDGVLALGHAGGGGGVFVGKTLAIVARAHGTLATDGTAASFSFFYGAGVQLRIVPRAEPSEYWFFEIVPGYETTGMGEVGNTSGLGFAMRAGVDLSYVTLALGTTLLVDASSPRDYEQNDLTFVVGFHGGWLSD